MEFIFTWKFFSIISVVLLLLFWDSKNAVWGTMTIGVILGFIVAIFSPGFSWYIIGKGAIIGTFLGFIFEIPELIRILKNK